MRAKNSKRDSDEQSAERQATVSQINFPLISRLKLFLTQTKTRESSGSGSSGFYTPSGFKKILEIWYPPWVGKEIAVELSFVRRSAVSGEGKRPHHLFSSNIRQMFIISQRSRDPATNKVSWMSTDART